MAIQCVWNLHPSVHWNATGGSIVGSQCVSRVLPVAFQWLFSVFQLCQLTLDCHWDTAGCQHQSEWLQWHHSVLVASVVSQCVPIMQMISGLDRHRKYTVIASASVDPMQSVQWYPSALTASGLGTSRSVHTPACNPLCIQLIWWELFELSWFHLNYNPNYTELWWYPNQNMQWVILKYTFEEQNWYTLQISKLKL